MPQSYYTSKVLCEIISELYVSIWRYSSATHTVQPNWKILPQYCNATSACQKVLSNCVLHWKLTVKHPPCHLLELLQEPGKIHIFLCPLAHCIFSKQQVAAHHPALWKLSSSVFLFQPKPLQVPHLNPVMWKVNNTVTPQTSWFNR